MPFAEEGYAYLKYRPERLQNGAGLSTLSVRRYPLILRTSIGNPFAIRELSSYLSPRYINAQIRSITALLSSTIKL